MYFSYSYFYMLSGSTVGRKSNLGRVSQYLTNVCVCVCVKVSCPLKPLSKSCYLKANRGWLLGARGLKVSVAEASKGCLADWLTEAMFTADWCSLAFGSKGM